MEATGLAASIVQLVNVTAKTIKYLNSVKHASEERTKLFREASSLLPLLVTLQTQIDQAQGSEPWFHNLRALAVEKGPLDQLKDALEQLAKKLKPEKGVKDVTRAFLWTLGKDYCHEILQTVERVKSRITLALQGDTLKLAQAIKADTATIGVVNEHVSDLSQSIGNLSLKQDSGAGKSVLASVVVDFLRNGLRKQHPVGVAAVYCNFKEHETQSLENLLAGLCMQLLQDSQLLPRTLADVYHARRGNGTRPSLEEILQVFKEAAKFFVTVYLVVDALDECLEEVRRLLIPQLKAFSPRTRLLVTTRFLDGILSEFKSGVTFEIRASPEDLRRYIRSRVEGNNRLARQLQGQTALANEICDGIIAKADGMFLAAKLHVDSLASKTSVKALKKAVKDLPVTLDDLYDGAIQRIDSQSQDDRELAEKALRWVAYTYRPLDVEALREALAIEPGETDLDHEAMHSMGLVLDVCAGLLIFDEQSEAIRLVHYTAQDYFNTLAESRFQEAHASIARDCITYLSYACFQSPILKAEDEASVGAELVGETFSIEKAYCFLKYASTFWGLHAVAGPETGLINEIEIFLACNPRVALRAPWQYNQDYPKYTRSPRDLETYHGCMVAAYFGLANTLQRLLRDTDDINNLFCKDLCHEGWHALHFAALNDQKTAVEVLLDSGANIESRTLWGETPLHVAIGHRSLAAACALVHRGADVMAMTDYHRTPAGLVDRDGPIPFLQILLNAGAHISTRDVFNSTRLMGRVIDDGDLETAEWLLRTATLSTMDEAPYDSSALKYASRLGSKAMVEILLKYRADPNSRSTDGYPILHHAIESKNTSVVRLLLESGSDVDAQDDWGSTALHLAVHMDTSYSRLPDRTECLDVLLAHRPDVDKRDKDGDTALMIAISSGASDIVLRLLRYGADIDIRNQCGVTALHRACIEGHSDLVKVLVEHGATVDIRSMFTVSLKHDHIKGISYSSGRVDEILNVVGDQWASHVLIAPFAERYPTGLIALINHQNRSEECKVWKDGMTAFNIAVLSEDDEIVRLLKPHTKLTTGVTTKSFNQHLCEIYELSSIEEVFEEMERRWDTENRTEDEFSDGSCEE